MLGLASALAASPDIELVTTLSHEAALAWSGEWRDVDAVVVDAADEKRAGDQFPGVSVVRLVRAATAAGERRPLVVVVTGHSLHDGLRHRMAEADADLFFNRSDISSAAILVEVILHPENWRRSAMSAEPIPNLGIDRAHVDRFVAYVEVHGLEGALDPDQPARPDPRSRQWLRHRREMARVARIEPVNLTTGNRPREWEAPSIRQLSRIWSWAARIARHDR